METKQKSEVELAADRLIFSIQKNLMFEGFEFDDYLRSKSAKSPNYIDALKCTIQAQQMVVNVLLKVIEKDKKHIYYKEQEILTELKSRL